jgi:hypothetical protein
VAERRAVAAGEDGGKGAGLRRHRAVAYGVDTRVEAEETTELDAIVDLGVGESQPQQLPAGHQSLVAVRLLRNRAIDSPGATRTGARGCGADRPVRRGPGVTFPYMLWVFDHDLASLRRPDRRAPETPENSHRRRPPVTPPSHLAPEPPEPLALEQQPRPGLLPVREERPRRPAELEDELLAVLGRHAHLAGG